MSSILDIGYTLTCTTSWIVYHAGSGACLSLGPGIVKAFLPPEKDVQVFFPENVEFKVDD